MVSMMMQLELRSFAKKVGVTAGLIVFGACYLIVSGKQLLAAHYSESQDPVRLQRAVSLDPSDAENRDNLGRYFLALNQSPAAALPMLQEATRLNPHSAKYWFDLAASERSLGDIDAAKDSLGHALLADPHTPKIAWDAAN